MYEYLTVGKLKETLSNIPDESEIWFWQEKDNNEKEEVIMHKFGVHYGSEDNYKVPNIFFIVGE